MAGSTFNRLVQKIQGIDDLRIFMGLHVYAVWDFMHLLKGLRQAVGQHHPELINLVDELITEEEIDHLPIDLGGPAELSHFEIYVRAMREIGSPTRDNIAKTKFDGMHGRSLKNILADPTVPEASREFMKNTQEVLKDGRPEVVASAYTYGRELLVPKLFSELRNRLIERQLPCPTLNWYLERHISLDGETHGPLATQLVEELTRTEPRAKRRIEAVKKKTLEARERFWFKISEAIEINQMQPINCQ